MGSPRLFSLPPSSLFPFSPFFVLLLPPLLSSRLSTLSVLSLSTCTKTITANRTQMVVASRNAFSPPDEEGSCSAVERRFRVRFYSGNSQRTLPITRRYHFDRIFPDEEKVSQNSHETAKFKKQGKLKINRNTRVVIVEERGEREVSGWI